MQCEAKQYDVGPECPGSFDGDLYVWAITWYEGGDYDGGGLAVSLRKDGSVDVWDLGHCSCYGPLEGPSETVSLEKFASYGKYDPVVPGKERTPQDCDYAMWQAIMAKAYEMEEVRRCSV